MIHTGNTATSDLPRPPPATRPATQTASSVSGWIKQQVSAIKSAVIQQIYNLIPGMILTSTNDKEDSKPLGPTWTPETIINQQPRQSIASFPAAPLSKLEVPSNEQQSSVSGLPVHLHATVTAGLIQRHEKTTGKLTSQTRQV
jgi:hypothetical protein